MSQGIETYGSPQKEQIAPSWTGAPQFGQRFSRTSPHSAQYFPPAGSAAARSGRRKVRPSTSYAAFDGHFGFGQNPREADAVKHVPVGLLTGAFTSSETPNFFASFPITASFSFVPSPCSNIDNADCLQPTSDASSLWDSFAARRASFSLKQISGLKFVTGAYYGLYFIN